MQQLNALIFNEFPRNMVKKYVLICQRVNICKINYSQNTNSSKQWRGWYWCVDI